MTEDGNRRMVVDGGISSFGELLAASNRISHGLRAVGLQPGDSVSVVLHNDPSFIEVYLAAMEIGLHITPIRTSRASRGRPALPRRTVGIQGSPDARVGGLMAESVVVVG